MKLYTDSNWLHSKYIDEDLSQKKIAELCNVDQSTIHKYLIRLGIPTRPFRGRSGKHSSRWNGGRTKTTQGYFHIYKPDHPLANIRKYVPEQILIAEQYLHRFLKKGEAIHHINEIKSDNRIENLYLFSSEAEHQRYHQLYRFGKVPLIIETNLL